MEYLQLILTVVLITFIAAASPGPSFLVVAQNTLTHSKKIGFYTSCGVLLGDLLHVTYCLLGIGVIIANSLILFNIIKFIGSAYLIYIGIKSLRSKPQKIEQNKANRNPKNGFKDGFFTTALNPKATLLFLSLFTVTIPATTPWQILIIITLCIFFTIFTWNILFISFLNNNYIRKIFTKFENWLNKIFGALLIGLGIKVATSEK